MTKRFCYSHEDFRKLFSEDECRVLENLDTPRRIQDFLDETPYSPDPVYRSPRSVMRDRKAHCVDGAFFAAAAMRYHGQPGLVLELGAVRDDDHFLAVFRSGRFFGAIAKSNFVGLRFREPIFGNLRELALSYFDVYYNLDYEKSLRNYSLVLDMSRVDYTHWPISDERLEEAVDAVVARPHRSLITLEQEAALSLVDKRMYDAMMLGADPNGIYDPSKH